MFPQCVTVFVLMNARYLFVYGALLFVLANGVDAEGTYQRTKDGRTRVWNNNPKRGDAATWSGDRDKDRYATGYGTLTWYTMKRQSVTGSNLPSAKYTVISHYSGIMVKGKLDGMVENVDANGKIFHGTFIDGRKGNDWIAGPASGPVSTAIALDQRRVELVPQAVVGDASPREPMPAPPAEGPRSSPVSLHPPVQSSDVTKQTAQPVSATKVTERPSPTIDDSLQSLIGPASSASSGMDVVAEPSSQASMPAPAATPPPPVTSTSSPPAAGPRLTTTEVIGLADAEAHKQGYNPGEYRRPQTDYVATDETWSVSYHVMYADGASKHFTVSVDDKTKKTSFTTGR